MFHYRHDWYLLARPWGGLKKNRRWLLFFIYRYVKKSQRKGCVIPHCNLQCRIAQPVLCGTPQHHNNLVNKTSLSLSRPDLRSKAAPIRMNEDCKPSSFFNVFALKCTIRSNSNAHPSECNYLSSTRTSKGTKTKKKSEIDDLGFVLHALLRAFSLFYTI